MDAHGFLESKHRGKTTENFECDELYLKFEVFRKEGNEAEMSRTALFKDIELGCVDLLQGPEAVAKP
eukprot:5752686-Prymnesium_polylepis.1